MYFSEGFKFYVTDVNRIVISFSDWVNIFYEVADKMRGCFNFNRNKR